MMPQKQSTSRTAAASPIPSPKLKIFPKKRVVETCSPALQSPASLELPAYEMKFILSEKQAKDIEACLSDVLVVDGHDLSTVGGGYQITTLYTDTDLFDVFYHEKPFRRHKYRLRRYGTEPLVYLERRSRWRDRIKKQRNTIRNEEMSLFSDDHSPADWAGHWFHRRLIEGDLHPVCRVSYRRNAYFCDSGENAMRLTFDREVRGCAAEDWAVAPFEGGLPVVEGQVICEVKFCSVMPPRFKQIVRDFELRPTRISKYRAFMRISSQLSDKRSYHA
jgi:hypothetical protein